MGRRIFGQPDSAKLFWGFPRLCPVGKKKCWKYIFFDVKTRFLKGSAPLFKIGLFFFLDPQNRGVLTVYPRVPNRGVLTVYPRVPK